MFPRTVFPAVLCAAGSLPLLALLTGCGAAIDSPTASPSAYISGLAGTVHGGQQPISGATVRVMAPGTSGYGSAPTVLSTAITDSGGGFSMPAYLCTTNNLVYLTVNGGNSGSGANPLIGEAAVIGPCSSAPTAFVRVSEVTTIAAAYTLAPFATVTPTATNIGTSATNTAGLNNTATIANFLAPYSLGYAPSKFASPGLILPTEELNTLANIIASCVNTNGSTTSGSPCQQLFAATVANAYSPVDTFQAALNIALNPSVNTSTLYALPTAAAPFQPTLTGTPPDFALGIGYIGGTINSTGTTSVAIDGSGNAWVTSGTVGVSTPTYILTRVSPNGSVNQTSFGSACGVGDVAIDTSNNIYVSCPGNNTVRKFTNAPAASATYTSANLSTPLPLAFDAAGNLWIGNDTATGGEVAFSSAGVELAGSPFAAGPYVSSIAAGPSAIWSTRNAGAAALVRLDNSTHAVQTFSQSPSVLSVDLDHSGNVWAAAAGVDQYFDPLSAALEASDSGVLLSPTNGYATGTLINFPEGTAVDGLGRTFTTSYLQHSGGYTNGKIQEFSPTGAIISSGLGGPTTNYMGGPWLSPLPINPTIAGAAIDASGNLWVAGNEDSTNYAAYKPLAMMVGLAAPVLTPKAAAVATNSVGIRP